MPRSAGDQLDDARKSALLVQRLAAGMTVEAAGKSLNLTVHEARRLKAEALRAYVQDSAGDLEAVLGQDLASLEMLLRAAMTEAVKGSKPHIDSALRVLDHKAKLLGLYRPEQVEIRVGAVDAALDEVAAIVDGAVEVKPLRRAIPPGAA